MSYLGSTTRMTPGTEAEEVKEVAGPIRKESICPEPGLPIASKHIIKAQGVVVQGYLLPLIAVVKGIPVMITKK